MQNSIERERPVLPVLGSDVQGLARLGVVGVQGITDVVEAMHLTIGRRAGILGPAPQGRTSGVTGTVYAAVRGTTGVVGKTVDALLGLASRATRDADASPQRDAFVAALNGLWGDHLTEAGNPLAIPMALRMGGRTLDLDPDRLREALGHASGKILVLVHGLCLSDRQWKRSGHDHGQALARDLRYTPVYLYYNTGRHISQNGREFAGLLERLVAAWPVPVDELAIVGHSMGGLVTRSACHVAREEGQRWLSARTRLVFLGTPHHGATLERGGHVADVLLGASPYVEPLTRLGKVRSAGITDLRFGNLQDADWSSRDKHDQHRDDRSPTPLPEGVPAYVMAACMAEHANGARARLIGDGLVPLASALGEHHDPAFALRVPAAHRQVVPSAGHLDLLNHPEVYQQLRRWLAPGHGPHASG